MTDTKSVMTTAEIMEELYPYELDLLELAKKKYPTDMNLKWVRQDTYVKGGFMCSDCGAVFARLDDVANSGDAKNCCHKKAVQVSIYIKD